MAEGELGLAGQAGRRPPDHEPVALQAAQAGGDPLAAEGAVHRVLPEDPPDHGRPLQHPLVGGHAGVDAGGQQRLEAVGERARARAGGQVQDQLLQEQRVPLRPGQDLLDELVGQPAGQGQAVEQLAAVPLGQRP